MGSWPSPYRTQMRRQQDLGQSTRAWSYVQAFSRPVALQQQTRALSGPPATGGSGIFGIASTLLCPTFSESEDAEIILDYADPAASGTTFGVPTEDAQLFISVQINGRWYCVIFNQLGTKEKICKSVYVRQASRHGNVMVLPWVNVCTLSEGEDEVNICCPLYSSSSSTSGA